MTRRARPEDVDEREAFRDAHTDALADGDRQRAEQIGREWRELVARQQSYYGVGLGWAS